MRLRTIPEAAAFIKARDPETYVSEWMLRKLTKQKKIPAVNYGNKYLIDLARLEADLAALAGGEAP